MNYKDTLQHFTKEQLIEMMTVTPEMVEKCEVELIGGVHQNGINGVDGHHNEHGMLEVKTQRWRGKFQLFGRAKFGAVSIENYKRKLEENELVIVTGYDEKTGEVFYRFHFRFEAVANRYLDAVHKCQGKNWTNYDAIPLHYKNHATFKVDYIADRKLLLANSHVFRPAFLKWLLSH